MKKGRVPAPKTAGTRDGAPAAPKACKPTRGQRVLAALLRGGKVKGDIAGWLKLTRGTA